MDGRSGSYLDERIRIVTADDGGSVVRNYRESLDDHLDLLVPIHFTPEDIYQIPCMNVNDSLRFLDLFQRIRIVAEEGLLVGSMGRGG